MNATVLDLAPLPGARPAPIAHSAPPSALAAMEPKIVDLCAQAARSAGLTLADEHLALLCAAAPHLLEMIERVRSAQETPAEPSNVFMFPRAD